MAERLVALGAVTKPHGVRGEVRVHRFNPESDLLLGLTRVWLRKDETLRAVDVESSRRHGELVLYTFVGVRNREAAEALRGHEVCVPRDQLPSLDDDEHYHVDLVGLRAEDAERRPVGIISEVIRYPASDCLLLSSDDGQREVPIAAPYVVEIDVEGGRIVLAHLEDFEVRREES